MDSKWADKSKAALVKTKHTLAKEILRLTEGENFSRSGTDAESERYIALYNKRESLVRELAEVHEAICCSGYDTSAADGGENIGELAAETEAFLKKVISIDQLNKNAAAAMLENAKKNIKQINQSRNLSLKYNNELKDSDGYLVNEKN